ncbi:signal recognition particle receptor subunit alpha, partial [bacterium]|nr:signal recognition particle receptor subunit alpha [bacterium]
SNDANLLLKNNEQKNSEVNFDQGLKKTNNFFVNSLNKIIYKNVIINDELFHNIEETLLSMDVGNYAVNKIITAIKNEVKYQNIDNPNLIKQIIIDKLFVYYIQDTVVQTNLNLKKDETNVILFFGVNGVGKTTTIAKIANYLQKNNLKICLVAGDTFRAGAVEQLDL